LPITVHVVKEMLFFINPVSIVVALIMGRTGSSFDVQKWQYLIFGLRDIKALSILKRRTEKGRHSESSSLP